MREQIVAIIVDTLQSLSGLPGIRELPSLSEETLLYGNGGCLTSLMFVNMIVEVEERIHETLGDTITIVNERAFSQNRSPFRTIGSLSDYIQTLMDEKTADV